MPIIVGMFGPVMSASSSPTFAPSAASATARFVEMVDLPTPPLFEATAMTFFTPATGFGPPSRAAPPRTSAPQEMSRLSMPGTASSAALTSFSMVSRSSRPEW